MRTTIAARVQALRDMTVPELRTEYARVFGEEARSAHKELLWRAIAWRIQANAEGDLPERVRRRAAELARDADLRTRVPRDPFRGAAPPPEARTARRSFAAAHDARLPLPGTVLTREYRGREVRVTVLDRGFEHEGTVHRSLSAVAKAVTHAVRPRSRDRHPLDAVLRDPGVLVVRGGGPPGGGGRGGRRGRLGGGRRAAG